MKKFFAVTLILGLLLSASALLAGNSAYQDIQWFNENSASMELSSPSVGLIIRDAFPGAQPTSAYDSSTTLSAMTTGRWGVSAEITDGGMPDNTDLALVMDFQDWGELPGGDWGYTGWGEITEEVYNDHIFSHEWPGHRVGMLYNRIYDNGGTVYYSDANRRLYYRFSATAAAPVQSFSRTIVFTLDPLQC